jgi:hypothetical protein
MPGRGPRRVPPPTIREHHWADFYARLHATRAALLAHAPAHLHPVVARAVDLLESLWLHDPRRILRPDDEHTLDPVETLAAFYEHEDEAELATSLGLIRATPTRHALRFPNWPRPDPDPAPGAEKGR